jgi:16S rRNA (cytosine967-C5)-methyltransferase
MTPAQFSACDSALHAILPFTYPADACLSHFFRTHPKLGSQDRHIVAETVFAILRHLQTLRLLVSPDKANARKLLTAWLARQYNLREFESALSEEDLIFAKAIKAKKDIDLSLAQKAELPDWIVAQFQQQNWTEEAILTLGRAMQTSAPLDLRVNTLKTKRDDVLTQLQAEGIKAIPTPYSPFGIRLASKPALQRLALFTQGHIEVQDEGSQLLGLLLAPRRNEMVVDFCAGAGGKTLLLGALMHSTGRLYALDISEKRLNNLKPRLKRSGLSNVHPLLIQHEHDARITRLNGKIDKVLVDAPCSGLGTLRRNPDLRFRHSEQSVKELQAKQASILQSAANLLKPGGRLVYATCSILPQENQDIIEEFLKANPAFILHNAQTLLEKQRVNVPLSSVPYFQLFPNTHQTDGFFAAVIERQA